jgi:hypothetical protein
MSRTLHGKEYPYYIEMLQLINRAREDGIVLTIDLQPRYPLAMGNYDMIPHARYSRAAQTSKLWMLHILGPDDIVAAPSFMEAVKVAGEFNAFWHEYTEQRRAENPNAPDHWPTVNAVIEEWDGSAVEHIASVQTYWADYLGYGESLKALKEMKS